MAYYIYKHLDSNENVIYCGQTKNIEKRQSEHLLNSKWKEEILKIEYAEVSDRMLMDLYEKYYISFHAPKYNIKDISCDYIRFFENLKELTFREYNKYGIKSSILSLSDDSLGKLFKLYLIVGKREITVETIGKILNTKTSATYLLVSRLLELNLIYKVKDGLYVLNDRIEIPKSFDVIN